MKKLLPIDKLLWLLLAVQALINLVGALGPELGFDALWYHLPEARLFLADRSLAPIPGSLLYWSGLPRLSEAVYALVLPLSVQAPKLIHWLSGMIAAFFVFKIARKKLPQTAALAAGLLFYSTLLVGWLATTAYVDLSFTALFLAAVYFTDWRRPLFLVLSGAVKLQAVAFGLVLTPVPWAALGALPFWLVNFFSTGNLFYPFGEGFNLSGDWFFNGFGYWLTRPARLFFDPAFRVGPAVATLVAILVFKLKPPLKKILKSITFWLFIIWWFLPGTGFGRFALPLLGLMAVVAARLTSGSDPVGRKLALVLIVTQAVVGIGARAYANAKYLPVLLGQESRQEFLLEHLNFDFGDFYDESDEIKNLVGESGKVLVYNIHNLYYVDFPFDHQSWAGPRENYTHVLVGSGNTLSEKLKPAELIYQNHLTRVKLFKLL